MFSVVGTELLQLTRRVTRVRKPLDDPWYLLFSALMFKSSTYYLASSEVKRGQ